MSHVLHINPTQEPDAFGLTVEDGEHRYHLQIGQGEAKARSLSFSELYKTFQEVEPAERKEWLERNGAVTVPADRITQTIVVDARAVRMQAANNSSAKGGSN